MNKIDGYIGLAAKAGKIAFGGEGVADAARHSRTYLALLAGDAADNTKKLVLNKCKSFGVKVIEYSTKDSLAHLLGKRSVSAVAILDKGLAEAIVKIFGGDR